MSQAKVDFYKEQKANRKKIMKREKIKSNIAKACTALLCVAILAICVNSVYEQFFKNVARKSVTVDYSAMDTYLETLQHEEEVTE